MIRIFVLGPEGTNSHEAAKKFSQSLPSEGTFEFCETNREALERALHDRDSLAVVPVENGSAGYVGDVLRGFWLAQLAENVLCPLKVEAELELPISHHLLVHRSVSSMEGIEEVISHPQALEQCSAHLKELNVRIKADTSTAAAAKCIAEGEHLKKAAVATAFAAKIYGLKILHANIEDFSSNATRFHLVGRKYMEPTGKDRTAVMFRLPGRENKAGSLISSLLITRDKGINMTQFHSIPVGKLGHYAFYCEFECHADDEKGLALVSHLRKQSEGQLFILGSFPRFCERKEGEK
ncbi:MAG: prephenate dehydratase domain-containing protein [Patescibacteria group bacterium]|nr:prephenate dehydratase domain-containing protein [bacterium]MDZ4240987.1 prephenate dehydratase domain-containing protein [Patescibacteria group bacterium]